ncbi:hypothetical protein HBN83_02195 [Pseudomonas fragi]|uniref:hypothetical protein n=1 Tax=Pseudomonas fragi TaxID=296 RepID=UPI001474C2BC|nr:hypothetical protein [Pseudomonas fragi]NNB04708.1 hypothetical protein [Pseudomonas fragi]
MYQAGSDENDLEQRENLYRYTEYQKQIRSRLVLLVSSFTISIVFFLSGILSGDKLLGFIPFPQEFLYALALMFVVIFFGWLTYSYVQGIQLISPRYISSRLSKVGEASNESVMRIADIEERLAEFSRKLKGYDSDARDTWVEDTVEVVKSVASQKIWEELSSSVSKNAYQDRVLAPIHREYEQAKLRLLSEVNALGKRGNVNLALGVATTIAALLIFSSLALSTIDPEFYKSFNGDIKVELVALSIYVIPKISLAIFIQIFALFFLNLYKSGLAEIKYFQNEMTNLEMKYFGIVAAISSEDRESVSEVAKLLLEVERNHILSQGQTTVELEKHKIEQSSSAEVLKLLPKLFGKKTI